MRAGREPVVGTARLRVEGVRRPEARIVQFEVAEAAEREVGGVRRWAPGCAAPLDAQHGGLCAGQPARWMPWSWRVEKPQCASGLAAPAQARLHSSRSATDTGARSGAWVLMVWRRRCRRSIAAARRSVQAASSLPWDRSERVIWPPKGDDHPRLTNGSPACVFHQGPLQQAASMTVCSFAVRLPLLELTTQGWR